jgi:hypothetical protein
MSRITTLTSLIIHFILLGMSQVINATQSTAQTVKEVWIKNSSQNTEWEQIRISLSSGGLASNHIGRGGKMPAWIKPDESIIFWSETFYDFKQFAILDYNWFKKACKNGWPSGAEILSHEKIIPFCNPKPFYEATVFNMSSRHLSNIGCYVANPTNNPESCTVSHTHLNPSESATITMDMTESSQGLIKWVNDSGRIFQVNVFLEQNDPNSVSIRPLESSQNQVAATKIDGSPFIWKITFTQTGNDPDNRKK